MGMDVYGRLIFGIQVKREDFFKKTGSQRQCIRCLRVAPPTEKFCPEDGQKLSDIPIDEPTPEFVKLAQTSGTTPNHLWTAWRDVEANDESGLGLHVCESMQNGGERDPIYALGYLVAHTKSHRSGRHENNLTAIDINDLLKKVPSIRETSKALGFADTTPIKVFHCIYLSY